MNTTNNQRGKTGVIVAYTLLSALLLLYTSFFSVVPLADLFGVVATVAFSACYSVLLANASFTLCLIPPAASVAVIFASAGSTGEFSIVSALMCVNLVFSVLLAVCLNASAVKKVDGGVTFVALSAVTTAYVTAVLLFFVYDIYGSVDLTTVKKAISDVGSFMGNTVRSVSSVAVLPTSADSVSAYDESLLDSIETVARSLEATIIMHTPALVVTYAMFISALCLVAYRPFVRIAGLQTECLYGRNYRFTVSKTSAVAFEILVFVYIVVLFASENDVIRSAFVNLVSVLTLPFAYIGLRTFMYYLANKISSIIGAKAIVIAGTFVILMFLGSSVLMFVALCGSSAVVRTHFAENNRRQ